MISPSQLEAGTIVKYRNRLWEVNGMSSISSDTALLFPVFADFTGDEFPVKWAPLHELDLATEEEAAMCVLANIGMRK